MGPLMECGEGQMGNVGLRSSYFRLLAILFVVVVIANCSDNMFIEACDGTVDPNSPFFDRFEATGFANSCVTDADCLIGGCSSEVCAAEPVATSCDSLPEHPSGSCGCIAGQCIWNECARP